MVDMIKKQFVGEWIHTQDDHLPPFFEAIGATEAERQFMLPSTPHLVLEVDNDGTVRLCDTPHPETQPDMKADVKFKLDQEFKFEPRGHCLQVKVTVEDGKMIQTISPIESHTSAYTIELSIGSNTDLVQKYRTTDSNGKDVTGTRRYTRTLPAIDNNYHQNHRHIQSNL